MRHPNPIIHRLAALALALTVGGASAQAETLEGTLEKGPSHSVLWTVSPESGDLIGQVFANASQAGQTILAHCLPSLHCVAQDASTAEPTESLLTPLRFSDSPLGWWLIEQVGSAHMQQSLPMSERQLNTRHGQLSITDENLLLFNGRPVLESAGKAAEPPPPPTAPQTNTTARTLVERISAWWQSWWGKIRSQLLTLLGRAPVQEQATAPAQPITTGPTGTAEAVQGNNALRVVAHVEQEGRQDIALLENTGGSACPALYRFATLTPQGISVTPEFGTCSAIAAVTFDKTQDGTPMPQVTMTGFLGPFEPAQEIQRAHMQLHRFVLRQGLAQKLSE